MVGITGNADATVHAANMFNDKPKPGTHYVMVTLHVVRTSNPSSDPYFDITFSYIARDGTSYSQTDVVLPQDLIDAGNIPKGSNVNGNIAFLVKQSDIGRGVLYVEISNSENFDTATGFFALS